MIYTADVNGSYCTIGVGFSAPYIVRGTIKNHASLIQRLHHWPLQTQVFRCVGGWLVFRVAEEVTGMASGVFLHTVNNVVIPPNMFAANIPTQFQIRDGLTIEDFHVILTVI